MNRWILLAIPLALSSAARADQAATFEDITLPASGYQNNAGPSGYFVSGGSSFNNSYSFDPVYGDSWSGWSISNRTDKTTAGFTNQYSAITGMGSGGSSQYAVAYTSSYPDADPFHPSASYINLADGVNPGSIDVTNTTYTYLALQDGYFNARKFVAGDEFTLTIRGYSGLNGTGTAIGKELDYDLADFTNGKSFLLDTWTTLDLSRFAGARSLQFGLESTDNNDDFGMNTPAYFAADNFVTFGAVPEPGSLILMASGAAGLACLKRKRRRGPALMVGLAMVGGWGAASRADYDPQVGQAGSLGIANTSPLFQEWASSVVSITRGPQDITNPTGPLASFGSPSNALGMADGSSAHIVSLGDGGSTTLSFATPIANGAGADFAVFENGFLSGNAGLAFLELGFVDVSSDGVNFFRFPSVSLTQTDTQLGGGGLIDARNLHNLAGKYIAGYGTGFDLADLAGVSPLLDINHVIDVRITDVVGSINPLYGTKDSLGNLINDPFKTASASGGFDLNGVGVIHLAVPEPASVVLLMSGSCVSGLAARRRTRQNRAIGE